MGRRCENLIFLPSSPRLPLSSLPFSPRSGCGTTRRQLRKLSYTCTHMDRAPARALYRAILVLALVGRSSALEDWHSCADAGGAAGKDLSECEVVKHVPDHQAWHLLQAIANGEVKKAMGIIEDYTPGPNSKPFPMLKSVFSDLPIDLALPDDKLGFFGQQRYFWRGATPLMVASAFAQPQMVQMLLKRHAKRDIAFGAHAKVPVAQGWKAVDMLGKCLPGCETSSPSLRASDAKPYSSTLRVTCDKVQRIQTTHTLLTKGLTQAQMEDDEL